MVIFWDTSALLPLIVAEPQSKPAAELARAANTMVVWWGTEVECESALARRMREGAMGVPEANTASRLLRTLKEAWTEINASDEVRSRAIRLLRRHPLRAADALQLGAALLWADDEPEDHSFATLDERLAAAAHGEGFVLPPSLIS